jgi:Caspase domain
MKKLLLLLIFSSIMLYANTDNRSLKIKKMHELEQRVALVVGNNNYESFGVLKNPINDARAMKALLVKKNFEVIYLEDTSQKKFKRAIKKFTNKLASGGVGLFYFAGHGIQVEGENYLIPKDADITDKDDVDGESVPVAYLTKKLKKAGNRLNIIILDACRNDPFSRGGAGGLAPIHARGTFIAYATEAGKAAKDGVGKHGVFTKHLIKYMEEPIPLDQVFKKTRTAVYNDTNGEQFPGTYNQVVNGTFFFTLPKVKNSTLSKFSLSIITSPKDAKVQIEGMLEDYRQGMKLDKGEYKIKIYKDGYVSKNGSVNLNKNQSLTITLNRAVSKTGFNETPLVATASEVFVDGKLMWQDNEHSVEERYSKFNSTRYCKNLKLKGFDDWKVPTADMLNSLKAKKDNLQNNLNKVYWAQYEKVTFSKIVIDAYIEPTIYEEEEHYIRCVRDN